MNKPACKHYIEILPAAYLSQRDDWQPVAQSLPDGGCLLVANPGNKEQSRLMQLLTQSFPKRGREVVVWQLGR